MDNRKHLCGCTVAHNSAFGCAQMQDPAQTGTMPAVPRVRGLQKTPVSFLGRTAIGSLFSFLYHMSFHFFDRLMIIQAHVQTSRLSTLASLFVLVFFLHCNLCALVIASPTAARFTVINISPVSPGPSPYVLVKSVATHSGMFESRMTLLFQLQQQFYFAPRSTSRVYSPSGPHTCL